MNLSVIRWCGQANLFKSQQIDNSQNLGLILLSQINKKKFLGVSVRKSWLIHKWHICKFLQMLHNSVKNSRKSRLFRTIFFILYIFEWEHFIPKKLGLANCKFINKTRKSQTTDWARNRKSPKCHFCRRSANLTNFLSPKICWFAIADLFADRPPLVIWYRIYYADPAIFSKKNFSLIYNIFYLVKSTFV